MSGDVQPRKRKDKKRKKDDSTEQLFAQPPNISPATVNEDVNIHVHKEEGTGGGNCAKVVFFLLFSALVVLIGLIITEHRGLTDLDTVEQESRFSQIFEGWIDSSPSHDEHDDHATNDLEDELTEQELEEETHDHEEEEEEEEEELQASEEVLGLDDGDDDDDEEPTEEVENDHEEQDEDDEQSEQSEEEVEDAEQNIESEEAENESKFRDEEEEEEDTEEDEEEEDEQIDEDSSQYIEEKSAEEQSNGDNGDDDDDDDDEASNQEDEDKVDLVDDVEDDENLSKESDERQEENTLEQEEKEELAELSSENEEKEVTEEAIEAAIEEKSSYINMVIKIGVGLALLVVAHVVLVRKWKSATPAPVEITQDEVPSDFGRRNTIVVPPTYQEVQHDIEENVEEYSDEDGEIESDDDRPPIKSTQVKYQELRTTYQRSLTPDSETENKQTDEDEYEEEAEEEIEEEEEEEEEDEEEGSDEDDEDLLKRLEAKYGKLQDQTKGTNNQIDSVDEKFSSWKRVKVSDNNEPLESDSDKQSDTDAYGYENITSQEDSRIKEKIDQAQATIRDNATYAIKLFDILLQQFPSSPRCLYGKAQALDLLAEEQRSNEFLQTSIQFYLKVLDAKDVPDALFEAAADRCINRMRFIGSYNRAVDVHLKLTERFPAVAIHKNQLVITYLIMNRVVKAKKVLEDLLLKHPDDGLALVHYGFILKTTDNKLNESVAYLRRGIASKAEGVIDGRFYFHLGDALSRLGRQNEAMQVYEEGVSYNLFLSKYQRSLYNVKRLKGQPWWGKAETQYRTLYTILEKNWQQIRDEGLAALNHKNTFQDESENLKDTGDWKQLELFARGQKNVDNCKKCPITCKIIESIPEARTCRRGQTKFSVMHPGTHVWPHCGPTNCRLRAHLGLEVPEHTYIRVEKETRSWKEGKVFIFDDSFEHEVWHNGTTFRLVLIVDVWHPELTPQERRGLSPI